MTQNLLKNTIVLKKIEKETSEIYSFEFSIPEGLEWTAGQHGIFRYTDREIEGDKGFRIFSIASTMEEGFLIFSTRIVDDSTEFKHQLLNLKPGDKMTVEGVTGKFGLKGYNKKACMMAGGIGITPVRALVKQLELSGEPIEGVTVLYSDDRGEFAFEKGLREAVENVEGLSVEFISDRNLFIEKIKAYSRENGNDSVYLISGTPGMNAFITDNLTKTGIDKENIITDTFMGY